MANGLGLGVDAASNHLDHHSEPIDSVTNPEWFEYYVLPRLPVEIFVHRFVVDQYRTVVVKIQTDLGDRCFPLAGPVIIILIRGCLYQSNYLTFVLNVLSIFLGLNLGFMGVFVTCIYLQPGEHLAT